MSPIDRARNYLAKLPPSISGQDGHGAALLAASALTNGFALSEHDAMNLMREFNGRCQPPWSERELEHKVSESIKLPHTTPRGCLLGDTRTSCTPTKPIKTAISANVQDPEEAAIKWLDGFEADFVDVWQASPIRPPEDWLQDGAILIENLYLPEELVNIVTEYTENEGKASPIGFGTTLTREAWLERLKSPVTCKAGGWLKMNPLRPGGGVKDSDVASHRFALLESDALPIHLQCALFMKLKLPIAAIITSGGRSLHAWVKIDAANHLEYRGIVEELLTVLARFGFDAKNKNPSRLSRLPGVIREIGHQDEGKQRLLYLAPSPLHPLDMAALKLDLDPPKPFLYTARSIGDLQPLIDDPSELVRTRFLCRGGGMVIAAPTGMGKSALVMQLMFLWAVGRSCFGLRPTKEIKSLLIQAENDDGDLMEFRDGVFKGLHFTEHERLKVFQNVEFRTIDDLCGNAFLTEALGPMVKKYAPDIVWIDPLLSYLGANVSQQEFVTPWLRNLLNPILHAANVACVITHHTGKPMQGKEKAEWSGGDLAYTGLGSSELSNWARAVMAIRSIGDHDEYELHLAKRGRRAGWKTVDGSPRYMTMIAHGDDAIYWREATNQNDMKTDASKTSGVGRPPGPGVETIVAMLEGDCLPTKEWQERCFSEEGISAGRFYELKKIAIEKRLVEQLKSTRGWRKT